MKGLLKHELKNMLSPYYLLYLVILTVFRLVQEAKPSYAAVYSLSFLLIVRLVEILSHMAWAGHQRPSMSQGTQCPCHPTL